MRRVRWFLPLLLCLAAAAQPQPGRNVIEARIEGAIMPPVRDYVARALARAESDQAACLLLRMDTPGGRIDSMREIAQQLLSARVPVVVYVAPAGARAASAGAVIALSANVVGVAPGTNIGAAHPVGEGGETLPSDIRLKAENDTAAFARAIAEQRGRDTALAEEIVRKSVSLSADQAVARKLADFKAVDEADLLRQLEGRIVKTAAGAVTLHCAGAAVQVEPLSLLESFLLLLFSPNVALILGLVAVYGIIAELNHPGAILPGVAGAIALVLTLYVFSELSVNGTGVALLLLAVALFVVDIYATTHGVLTAGGIVAFVVGAMMLFSGSAAGSQASLWLIIILAMITAAFFGVIVAAAVQSRRSPPGGGPEKIVGSKGVARTTLDPEGKVFADGAIWSAVNVGDEPIKPGDHVVVEGREGLTLHVRRETAPDPGPVYAHG